ncbi:MAG: response regulator receiver protein [Polaromonas sp.]|nr:response regulator receiver protein [Polaromonas sp.]
MKNVVLLSPDAGVGIDSAVAEWCQRLTAAGVSVPCTLTDGSELVHAVTQHAPDGVVVWVRAVSDGLLQALRQLAEQAPRPVLLLVAQPEPAALAQAVAAGVHDWLVPGEPVAAWPARLAAAQARFGAEQGLRQRCADLTHRWQERVAVDKAKGLLMQSQDMTDEQAFRLLRNASMNHSQRLGELARQVLGAAQHAERVNRCAQLRMLSQRLAKWQVLRQTGRRGAASRDALQRTAARVQDTLDQLDQHLGAPAQRASLAQVQRAWAQLEEAVRPPPPGQRRTPEPTSGELLHLNECSERLLAAADALTALLQPEGGAGPFQWLTTVGRQRMLSQRYAKLALLRCWWPVALAPLCASEQAATQAEFEGVMRDLNRLPLSNPDIQAALAAAGANWLALVHACDGLVPGAGRAQPAAGLAVIEDSSETVLDAFEQLARHYESSLELLLGTGHAP